MMAQPQITAKKQQGKHLEAPVISTADSGTELQQQYTNYKNSLQQLAQRIGEIEQDTEEHKYVPPFHRSCILNPVAI